MKIKGISEMKQFTHGHRGILYTGKYKGKKITIKAKRPESEAVGRIENEGNWLKRLNKKGIGPKLVIAEKNFFAYEFVEGEFICDYVEKSTKPKIVKLLRTVLDQCFILDQLNVDKEEMHHPVKHIVVTAKGQAVMLDFERAHIDLKPKNVTQFCQFLISTRFGGLLREKGIKVKREKMIKLARRYKGKMSGENLKIIISSLK